MAKTNEAVDKIAEESQSLVDMTMVPNSTTWNPKKYFDAQEQVRVRLHREPTDIIADPQNKNPKYEPVGINGYSRNYQTGKIVTMPLDFAKHVIAIGKAEPVDEIEGIVYEEGYDVSMYKMES